MASGATGATQSSTRKGRNTERAVTPDWIESTQRLLTHAANHKNQSETLRGSSHNLKLVTDKEVSTKGNEVNNLLKDKVNETTSIRLKLIKTQNDLEMEMQSLQSARMDTDSALRNLQRPIKVAVQRQNVRKQRPQREAINDHVERALHLETIGLQEALEELQAAVIKADEQLSKMDRCNKQLAADIDDKTVALRLDEECLQVDVSIVPVIAPVVKAVPGQKQVATAVNISPKRSKVVPEQWRYSSQKLLATALDLITQSQQLTKLLRKLVQQLTTRNEKANYDVESAFRSKLKQTTKLKSDLQFRLEDVTKEIDSLLRQREAVSASLEEKSAPLSVLKQRIAIRHQRPQREAVRDRVEEAMETELNKLTNAVTELHRKLISIDKQLKELTDVKRELERDLQDKTHALTLDQHCVEVLDGRSEIGVASRTYNINGVTVSSPVKLPPSPAKTPRTVTPRKSETPRSFNGSTSLPPM